MLFGLIVACWLALALCEVDPVRDRSVIHMRSGAIDTRDRADAFGHVGGGALARLRKRLAGRPDGFDALGDRKLMLVHTRRILRASERDALQRAGWLSRWPFSSLVFFCGRLVTASRRARSAGAQIRALLAARHLG